MSNRQGLSLVLFRFSQITTCKSNQPKVNYEEPQIKADGTQGWLRTSKVPLHDRDGRVIGVLGTYEDITEHKRVEEALRRAATDLRHAQHIAHVGSWDWHVAANRVTWSDELYRIYGVAPRMSPLRPAATGPIDGCPSIVLRPAAAIIT